MIFSGKIDVCWQRQTITNLPYESKGGYGHHEYIMYAHKAYKDVINNDVFVGKPADMPEFIEKVIPQMPKHDTYDVSFFRTPPGNYLPLHRDSFGYYIKYRNVKDIEKIYRYIVFLEDAKHGHMMQLEDTVHTNWKAGDYVGWTGSTPHAAYNFGVEHRYTMSVTCYDNPKGE